jgi:phosphoglycolate phosphatase-like HAD superfamily hydrolase
MGYKGVIFDLDGTLVHTKPECIRYMVSESFKEFGVILPDSEKDRFWHDHGREEILRKYDIDKKAFWPVFKKYDTKELRRKNAMIYEDVDPFIKIVRSKGFKLGILTGAPVHMMEIGTDLLGRENFDVVIRAQLSSKIKPKPDPEGLVKCMSQMKLTNTQTIYVGNGWEEPKTAKSAGVRCFIVDREEYPYVFDQVDIFTMIKSLNELREPLGL